MKSGISSAHHKWGDARLMEHERPTAERMPNASSATPFVHLQRRLVQDRLRGVDDVRQAVQIRWAAQEASALSWTTGFPLLIYPMLFNEKSEAAIQRAKRQEDIYARSRELLGLKQ